jgi:hypothetical protein
MADYTLQLMDRGDEAEASLNACCPDSVIPRGNAALPKRSREKKSNRETLPRALYSPAVD